jgi:hypothetical protein
MTTTASNNINLNVKHIYGRTNAPRKIFTGPNGDSLIYFESYCFGAGCDKNLLPNGISSNSTNDPRWFVNASHTLSDGVVGSVTQKNANKVTTTSPPTFSNPTQVSLVYDESSGYNYKTTMENNASDWLIYNKYNASDTTNEFEVEFISAGSSWGGVDDANSTTTSDGANKTNRRIMW